MLVEKTVEPCATRQRSPSTPASLSMVVSSGSVEERASSSTRAALCQPKDESDSSRRLLTHKSEDIWYYGAANLRFSNRGRKASRHHGFSFTIATTIPLEASPLLLTSQTMDDSSGGQHPGRSER